MKDETVRIWEMTRDAIKHEDNLRHKRLGALLTIEGFLVGGFFVFQGRVLTLPVDLVSFRFVEVFVLAVFLIGIVVCLNVHQGMRFANVQLKMLESWWLSHTERSDREQLPAVMGVFESPWFLDFTHIPVFLAFLNMLCAIACVVLIACGPLHWKPAATERTPFLRSTGVTTKAITVDDNGQLPPLPSSYHTPAETSGRSRPVL